MATTVISGSFTITVSTPPVPDTLAFTAQPQNADSGATLPPVMVAWNLPDGTVDASATGPITLSINTGTGTLGGTLTQTPVSGVATFSDLSITTTATGDFTLQAAG